MNEQSTSRRPTVCLISISPIADDARVRRHAESLAADGWDVVAVGLPGAKSRAPAWRVIDSLPPDEAAPPADAPDVAWQSERAPETGAAATSLPASTGTAQAIVAPAYGGVARKAARYAYWRGLRPAARLAKKAVAFVYWRVLARPARLAADGAQTVRSSGQGIFAAIGDRLLAPAWRSVAQASESALRRLKPGPMKDMTLSQMSAYLPLLKAHIDRKRALEIYWSWGNMQEMYEKAKGLEADLWIANDWSTLPIVTRLVAEKGGVYLYDSHEFGTQEYPNDWWWRAFTQPVAKAAEASCIKGAKHSFSVSPGIAKALNELYRLAPPNEVLRNMPGKTDLVFRPTGERIEVLYHGILSPSRGLEAAIESIPRWRPEFHLTIRGPGSPAYLASLRKLIRKVGVNDRVTLAPPLPMIELVNAAKAFDVGFFALLDDSPQNKYVLPNKFFEYVNAGLALCVSNCPDMAELLHKHDLGVLMKSTAASDIASAINGLDRAAIDRFKHNSIAAAEQLCWEAEQEKLLRACNRAIGRAIAAA